MFRKFILLNCAVASIVALAAGPECPAGADWKFDATLSDEFDAAEFDRGKWWDFTPWWRGRREYVNRAANVVQKDGKLELWAKRIPASEQDYEDREQGFWPYTCGIVKSRQKVTYGYFEVRAKGAPAEVRNAFWLYDPLSDGIERPWPKYARGSHSEEIDIYEFVGRFQDEAAKRPYKICSHVHRFETPYVEGVVNACQTKMENRGGQYAVGWRPCDDYHVYGLKWTAEEIVWHVDGVETYRRANDHYHTPLHVMIDVEIAKWRGADPSKLDASTLPAAHVVDYFRYWAAPAEKAEVHSFLKRGDVWVMSGDSITHNDTYRQTVLAALDHFHPGHGIRIMNTAVWGQLVSDANGQGLDLEPTVATIMLGMNNVIHRDYPATYDFTADAAKYAEAIRKQVRDFRKSGAAVVLMKPTLTDETEHSYFHIFHTRRGIEAYGTALEKVASEEECEILPIAADFELFKPSMKEKETLIPDGVHPCGWGQYAIARSLIHHLRLARPLAKPAERRFCDLSPVCLNTFAFRRTGPFLNAGERPRVVITAPRAVRATVRWSVEGSDDCGKCDVSFAKDEPFELEIPMKPASLPVELGTVGRVLLTVTPADGEPELAVMDLARTKVFHATDGVFSGEIRSEGPRKDGPLVGTWEVRADGSDLWLSGRMYATEWPKRKPAAKDRWMNSSGLNCVKTLFDFRPSDRFAENRFDRDVNMVVLGFLNDPWSTLAMPWMNREVGNCLVSHVEPAEGGYRWRLGFRGRVNDYTRFDISKLDYFGLTLLLADQEEKGIEHYPFYWQLWGAEKKRRVNPELRVNQTAIFDLKGVVPGNETTTIGVFGL